jgi:hypothetical protein
MVVLIDRDIFDLWGIFDVAGVEHLAIDIPRCLRYNTLPYLFLQSYRATMHGTPRLPLHKSFEFEDYERGLHQGHSGRQRLSSSLPPRSHSSLGDYHDMTSSNYYDPTTGSAWPRRWTNQSISIVLMTFNCLSTCKTRWSEDREETAAMKIAMNREQSTNVYLYIVRLWQQISIKAIAEKNGDYFRQ